jgi:cytochrome c
MQAKILILSAALFSGLALGAQAAEVVTGDVVAGEKVFSQCKQCHRIGPGATNFYGPSLNGLIGRKAGTVRGYDYSDATKHSGKVWDVATLTSYLKKPQHDIPGSDMTFKGLNDPADIDNVIAYIAQFDTSGGMIKK